jgi:hypothetical protein
MSLENIKPIEYTGKIGEYCFVPSVGLDIESARSLATRLAEKEAQIYIDALDGTREKMLRGHLMVNGLP